MKNHIFSNEKHTQEWVNQFNKKCCVYLGYKYVTHQDSKQLKIPAGWYKKIPVIFIPSLNRHLYLGRSVKDLKFYSDWNWLMRILKSIKDEKYWFYEITDDKTVIHNGLSLSFKCMSVDSLYNTIIAIDKYVDWYNKK